MPDMGKQTRSNPSPQSPAGTNPSDKGVWERGDVFLLDAQFVQCLLYCPFASPTVDLSDISMKPLSQSAIAFYRG